MKQVDLSPVQMNLRLQEIKKEKNKKPKKPENLPTITVRGMKTVFYK